jgi:hypothetical protein
MTEETKAATFEVKRWQTYAPCKTEYLWGEYRSKPFVVEAVVGDRVQVWDPTGGQRMGGYRWVALRNLHETGTTKHGKERKTGFRLHCEPPAPGQELCGSCFTWLDPDQFAILARGFGHSTCLPCKADIEARYPLNPLTEAQT